MVPRRGTDSPPSGRYGAMSVKVVIADDHGLVRQSLRQYLEMEEDIEVVGEASNGREVMDILDDADSDEVHLDHVLTLPRP